MVCILCKLYAHQSLARYAEGPVGGKLNPAFAATSDNRASLVQGICGADWPTSFILHK